MIVTLLLATGEMDLATEGVDEACARALAKWDRVGAMESPTGWVYLVALNHARRLARRKWIERSLLPRIASRPQMPPVATDVWQLVSTLPERQRQIVVLRHVADLKEAEIAEALHITRSTVSTTLRDAHHRLGSLLDDESPTRHEVKEIADV
jgi:RNA polymerase sigma factor (sigma-70 family)